MWSAVLQVWLNGSGLGFRVTGSTDVCVKLIVMGNGVYHGYKYHYNLSTLMIVTPVEHTEIPYTLQPKP